MEVIYRLTKSRANIPDALARRLVAMRLAARYDTRELRADYGSMTLDELRAQAKARGMYVHHRTGATKLRAMLEAAE